MKPKSLASRLFDRNSAAAAAKILNVGGAKYQMHVDCSDQSQNPDHEGGKQVAVDCRPKQKSPKEVHFAFLQEKYEPLKEDEARAQAKEEKKQKKKESYKKVKKHQSGSSMECWQGSSVQLEMSSDWAVQFQSWVLYPDHSSSYFFP